MHSFSQAPSAHRSPASEKPAAPARARMGHIGDGNAPAHSEPMRHGPGDAYEREADRISEHVMRTPAPQSAHACPCGGGCPKCQAKASIQGQEASPAKRSETGDAGHASAPSIVRDVLHSSGRPLDPATRAFMEPRFGHDFGQVRVHTDTKAARSAAAVNASAYTVGQDVVFGAGRYAPGTREGDRLLAHELTHTVQQRASSSARDRSDIAAGGDAVRLRSGTRLARQPAPAPSPLALPDEGVEMPWVGKGGTNSSDLGYLRDANHFWVRFRAVNATALSAANNQRINNGQAPIVDDDWIRAYPQHAAYRGDLLEHHHVGQGAKAVPLPSRLHDAYTVFHPQRRVVGTPARGTKPLPPQPTRADAQAQIDRHVAAGRIRGQGIAPGSSPQAPAVPPASAVAGVTPQRTAPVGVPTSQAPVRVPTPPAPMPIPTPPVPATRAAPSPPGRAPQSSGIGRAAGAAAAAALVDMIGSILLQRYFEDELNAHASAKIQAALAAFDMESFLARNAHDIAQAQSEGWEVRLLITIDTDWQATDIGNVLMKATVADCEVLYENQPRFRLKKSRGSFLGNALRSHVGSSLDSQTVEILLEGTDQQQRRYRKSRAEIEAMLNASGGASVEFESLLLRGHMGELRLDALRDYADHRRKRAAARGDAAAVDYWLRMETLAIGPVDDIIDQAKIKGLPLVALRKYAVDTAAEAGKSGDRASQHAYHTWSAAAHRVDAPLTDPQSADRQRYLWSRPAPAAELETYRGRLAQLERDIAARQQALAALRQTDARTDEERAGGEPPHPPWAKIAQIEKAIARLKEDLMIERRLLRDAEKDVRPAR